MIKLSITACVEVPEEQAFVMKAVLEVGVPLMLESLKVVADHQFKANMKAVMDELMNGKPGTPEPIGICGANNDV